MRPLLRLSRAGVGFAARRCKARIVCGVVRAPLLAETDRGIFRALGVYKCGCVVFIATFRPEAGRVVEARLNGVEGFFMIPASCRSFDSSTLARFHAPYVEDLTHIRIRRLHRFCFHNLPRDRRARCYTRQSGSRELILST